MENTVVMFDSPEAAIFRTDIVGWLSRDGRYFGNDPNSERSARWSGCTHLKCECGEVISRDGYTKCRSCMAKHSTEKYYALPVVEWDFKTPLCSWEGDKFFFSDSDVLDWMADLKADAKDGERPEVQLILCEPGRLSEIDTDHWCDDLHEDGELPDEVLTKLGELNEAIRNSKTVTWWNHGKVRVDVDALWMVVEECSDVE